MKIALILYPGVSLNETSAFLSVLENAHTASKTTLFNIEYCSYLPMHNGKRGLTLTSGYTGLPLTGFDLIVLCGGKNLPDLLKNEEWKTWLRNASPSLGWIGINQGGAFLKQLGVNILSLPQSEPTLNPFLAGLWLVNQINSELCDITATDQNLGPAWYAAFARSNGRSARFARSSAETKIEAEITLDGSGNQLISTGIPFLDHMLAQIARHGLFDIRLKASGDLEIDPHHTMEDCALTLGETFRLALGDRKGIQRMASTSVPMDESLATVTVDFSGRPYCVLQTRWNGELVADIPVSLVDHFLESFANAARCNLFVQVQAGQDNHHMAEAVFKALARALNQAVSLDPRRAGMIPSTKEVLF